MGAIYVTFKDKGVDFARQAVAEDEGGNYDKALQLYLASLEYFKTYLKYEKNPKAREAITAKVGGASRGRGRPWGRGEGVAGVGSSRTLALHVARPTCAVRRFRGAPCGPPPPPTPPPPSPFPRPLPPPLGSSRSTSPVPST